VVVVVQMSPKVADQELGYAAETAPVVKKLQPLQQQSKRQ
jgi:hypothetical protein